MPWNLMPWKSCVRAVSALTFLWGALSGETSLMAQSPTLAERLGYPKNAKLLILHADDLGAAYSIDRASFEALQNHDVSSASAMVPCPWFVELVEFAKKHPEADIGLHLTLNSEWKNAPAGSRCTPRQGDESVGPSGLLLRPIGGDYRKRPGGRSGKRDPRAGRLRAAARLAPDAS